MLNTSRILGLIQIENKAHKKKYIILSSRSRKNNPKEKKHVETHINIASIVSQNSKISNFIAHFPSVVIILKILRLTQFLVNLVIFIFLQAYRN